MDLTAVGTLVDSIVDSIVDSAIRTLGSKYSVFLFLPFLVVDKRSAVMETILNVLLISSPMRVPKGGNLWSTFHANI